MVLAVGYRVRSSRGTLFRQWVMLRLEELLRKKLFVVNLYERVTL
ncbi:MAG: virulence RhuM family protein [Planctomycetaceae bacterium]|nr:virulence RhuM family protein [Planctomycetaceae bacterium]